MAPYRTLNCLATAGVVLRHTFPDGKTRYGARVPPSTTT